MTIEVHGRVCPPRIASAELAFWVASAELARRLAHGAYDATGAAWAMALGNCNGHWQWAMALAMAMGNGDGQCDRCASSLFWLKVFLEPSSTSC